MKTATFVDPVCGMTVDPAKAAGSSHTPEGVHYFCSTGCKNAFDADPEPYLMQEESAGCCGVTAGGSIPSCCSH